MSQSHAKPNFFIYGSSKCGSSALATYLREHAEILFSTPKEPNYFNTDFYPKTFASDHEYVAQCFPGLAAGRSYNAVGEGSVRYIYSEEAAKNILRFNPEAKFIVLVRNPVDMFLSWYHQRYATEKEMYQDPEQAWRAQADREADNTPDARLNMYGPFCKLGEQLSRLYAVAPKEQVLVFTYDDLQANPRKVYTQTLDFLGVADDGRNDFPVVNKSRATGSELLHKLIRQYRRSKKKLGIRWGVGNTRIVQAVFFGRKKKLRPEFVRELKDYFTEDVQLLGRLLERDLSHWVR